MNHQAAYKGMDSQLLARIAQAEQAYQQASHTGTRCELLNAYIQAATYARENGASYEEASLWSKKAYTLAQSGARTEPCFMSYWDAAVICIQSAVLEQEYGNKQEIRAYLKCAAAWLEELRDKESPVEGCDAAAQLKQVYSWLASCE